MRIRANALRVNLSEYVQGVIGCWPALVLDWGG
jgi:hypothetical protein